MTASAAAWRTSRSARAAGERGVQRDGSSSPPQVTSMARRQLARTGASRRPAGDRLLGQHLLLGLGEQVGAVAPRGAQVVAAKSSPSVGEQLLDARVVERRPLELEEAAAWSRSRCPAPATFCSSAPRAGSAVSVEKCRRGVVAGAAERVLELAELRIASTRPGPSSSASLPAWAAAKASARRVASSRSRSTPVGAVALDELLEVPGDGLELGIADRGHAVQGRTRGSPVSPRRPWATTNASTTRGSNWRPAVRRNSASAAAGSSAAE